MKIGERDPERVDATLCPGNEKRNGTSTFIHMVHHFSQRLCAPKQVSIMSVIVVVIVMVVTVLVDCIIGIMQLYVWRSVSTVFLVMAVAMVVEAARAMVVLMVVSMPVAILGSNSLPIGAGVAP